jgi:hypothetical protein
MIFLLAMPVLLIKMQRSHSVLAGEFQIVNETVPLIVIFDSLTKSETRFLNGCDRAYCTPC